MAFDVHREQDGVTRDARSVKASVVLKYIGTNKYASGFFCRQLSRHLYGQIFRPEVARNLSRQNS